MKKTLFYLSAIALALLLCACVDPAVGSSGTAAPTVPSASQVPTVSVPETTVPETTVPETTAPLHSPLFLPEYTAQQIMEYFEEVTLRMEYSDGDATVIQKWLTPIRYRIHGDATPEDLAVLSACFAQLNEIPGFPGFHEAAKGELADLNLHFLDVQAFQDTFFEAVHGEDAYGVVQFWYYTETNEIYSADIGYRTDIDQATRNSVLIEEIVNALGISDTELRPDSVVYQYSDDNTALSDVDWVILNLLYDPAMQCGLDQAGCNAVISQLYY